MRIEQSFGLFSARRDKHDRSIRFKEQGRDQPCCYISRFSRLSRQIKDREQNSLEPKPGACAIAGVRGELIVRGP
jgi:hypothetical protein